MVDIYIYIYLCVCVCMYVCMYVYLFYGSKCHAPNDFQIFTTYFVSNQLFVLNDSSQLFFF